MPAAGQVIRALDFTTSKATFVGADELGFTDTAYAAGGTVCGDTFVAPTSGKVRVMWAARTETNTINVWVLMSFELREGGTIGAGTIVQATSDSRALEGPSNDVAAGVGNNTRVQRAMFNDVGGLTAGNTYNVRTMHKMSAAGNGDIFDRFIAVTPRT